MMKRYICALLVLMLCSAFTACYDTDSKINQEYQSDRFALSFKYTEPLGKLTETEQGVYYQWPGVMEMYLTSFFVASLEDDIMVQLGEELQEAFPDAGNVETKDGVYFGVPGFAVNFDVSENVADGKVTLYYMTDGNLSYSVFVRTYPAGSKKVALAAQIATSVILNPPPQEQTQKAAENAPKLKPNIIPD